MKFSSTLLVAGALAFSATSTAWAQTADQSTTAATPAPQAKKTRDPNEIVCQKIEDISSRIATKRVCMTRSQWAEQQRQDRLDLDKAQIQRPCNASGGC
ncbi:MAG TPA: hypothetical protein VF757_03790 [Sphingomicrobium sp.]